MFHNLVVAVDGSESAEQALMYAIDLSESAHGRLTLFTAAVEPPTLAYWAPAGLADVIEAAETQAARIASHARQRVPDRVPVTCVVTSRPIRQALMRQISVGQHDLVVVGSRGHGSVNSAVLGGRQPLHSSPQPGAGAGCPRRSLASELERSRRRWSGRSTTPEACERQAPTAKVRQTVCSWRVKSVVLLPRHTGSRRPLLGLGARGLLLPVVGANGAPRPR